MSKSLIQYDLSLPWYFSYPPAPEVRTRAMIPRGESRQLYIRGEYGTKADGGMRPLSSHNATHLDVPFHFLADGADMAEVLNNPAYGVDRPCLARVVALGGNPTQEGSYTREGVVYCEAISAALLPPLEVLRTCEALVILTGFGRLMTRQEGAPFSAAADGFYHIPYLLPDAVAHILACGIQLVAIDSPTVEEQTSASPLRMGNEVHFRLLGNAPPVFILEGLDGSTLLEQVGMMPHEGLLHMVPRRTNAAGGEAAQGRAFLYFYRDDPHGEALRNLAQVMREVEMY